MLVIINNTAIIILKLILFGLMSNIAESISYAGEYYALSFMYIVFVFRLTLITSIKYNLLKIFQNGVKFLEMKGTENEKFFKKFWGFYIIIILLSLVPEMIFSDSITFLRTYTDALDVDALATREVFFALSILCFIVISENTKSPQRAYIFESLSKLFIKYSFPLTFFIYISSISSKYYYIKLLKEFGIFIILILVIYLIIKYIIILKRCREKNKTKIGKENLIVLVSSNNIELELTDTLGNPLNMFRKFNTTKVPTDLMIEGSKYTFVNYTAVRNKLLDIKKFKNIAYLFILNKEIYTDKKTALEKFIQKVEEDNQKFIIYEPKFFGKDIQTKLGKTLSKKYPYRYVRKINTKEIIHIVNLTNQDDILKKNCYTLLNFVKEKDKENYLAVYKNASKEDLSKFESDKNRYIKYALNSILNSFNHIEYFYALLKMSEYVIHYTGLKVIIDAPEKVDKTDVKSGTLASWRKCINSSNFNKEYKIGDSEEGRLVKSKDLISSIIEIRKILNLKNKRLNETYYFIEDLSKIIADIRNNLAAHGSISYDLAKTIVMPLFDITCTLIQDFEELNFTIKEDDIIHRIFSKDITAISKDKGEIYLYSNTVTEKEDDEEKDLYRERLNYETGKRKVIDTIITINIDKRLSNQDITQKYKGGISNINGTKKFKK